MHSFVEHFLATKKASLERFCEAALNFGPEVVSEIERHLPYGTAINYISKIRALRDFIVTERLGSCEASELLDTLHRAGITSVNHISRRKLNGDYAESRQTMNPRDELVSRLRGMGSRDLTYIRNFIDQLLVQDEKNSN